MIDDQVSSRLVYSTEHGPTYSKKRSNPKSDGVLRLRYEIKGRKGKGMTLITGLPLKKTELLVLARRLKQQFGSGGSVKDYTIEIQGDHRRAVGEELRKLGYILK